MADTIFKKTSNGFGRYWMTIKPGERSICGLTPEDFDKIPERKCRTCPTVLSKMNHEAYCRSCLRRGKKCSS